LSKIEWYRRYHPEAPVKFHDVFFGRYYFDNAILRFYPAGEDLSEFIVAYLKIPERETGKIGESKKSKISKASKVGDYLLRQYTNHDVTKRILQLHQNSDWKRIINYRNEWVHEQPPIFKGEGIRYNRNERWQKGILIEKCGDEALYDLDEMLEYGLNALRAFFNVLHYFSEILFRDIENLGISIDFSKRSLSLNPFQIPKKDIKNEDKE
jgi:hypothetical protein